MDLRCKLRFIFLSQLILAGFLFVLSIYNFSQNPIPFTEHTIISNNTPQNNTVIDGKKLESLNNYQNDNQLVNNTPLKSTELAVNNNLNNLKNDLVIDNNSNDTANNSSSISNHVNNTPLITNQSTNDFSTSNNQNLNNQNSPPPIAEEEVVYHLAAANPNPSVSNDTGDFTLEEGKSKTITFYIKNSGGSAGESYIDISYSSGLTVNTKPNKPYELSGDWTQYGPGTSNLYLWHKDGRQFTALYNQYIFSTTSIPYSSYQRSFAVTFTARSGSSGSHWVKYRVSMKKSDGTGDYIRYPSSAGNTDQQGYYALRFDATITKPFQNPYLDISQTNCNSGKYEIGDTFTCSYRVYNPNNSLVTIGLGASIRKIGTSGDGLSNPGNDQTSTISANSWGSLSRSFKIPSDAQYGDNEYILAIWSGWPGSSTKYDTTAWKSGINLNHRPTLYTAGIDPSSAKYLGTTVTFSVYYKDLDNEAPSNNVKVKIGGSEYHMSRSDWWPWPDYTDGEKYEYSISSLSRGSYAIKYNASDGNFSANELDGGSVTIENRAPNKPGGGSSSTSGTTAVLSWNTTTDPDSDSVTYKVYLGLNSSSLSLLGSCNGISGTGCSLSGLSYSTLYYWRVDAVDSYNSATNSSDIWNFTTSAPPRGDLQVILKNVGTSLQTIPGGEGLIRLYRENGDYLAGHYTQNSNGDGVTTFDDLDQGNYYVRGYFEVGARGEEYWGQSSTKYVEGNSASDRMNYLTFIRNNPYAFDLQFYRGATNEKIDMNSTFYLGETIRAEMDVTSNLSSTASVKANLIYDQSKDGTNDYDSTQQDNIISGSPKRFTFYFTPNCAGKYYRTLKIKLSDDTLADGWVWYEVVNVKNNNQPTLGGEKVEPGQDYSNKDFTFWVKYQDVENDAPAKYKIRVYSAVSGYDSGFIDMVKDGSSTDYITGVWYKKVLSSLPAGLYSFDLVFNDGRPNHADVTGGKSGTPTVLNSPPVFQPSSVTISPANNAKDTDINLDITWDGAFLDPDGDQMKYQLYLGTTQSNLQLQTCQNELRTGCVVNNLMPGQQYYWQVKANDGKNTPVPTSIWNFTTRIAPEIIWAKVAMSADDPSVPSVKLYEVDNYRVYTKISGNPELVTINGNDAVSEGNGIYSYPLEFDDTAIGDNTFTIIANTTNSTKTKSTNINVVAISTTEASVIAGHAYKYLRDIKAQEVLKSIDSSLNLQEIKNYFSDSKKNYYSKNIFHSGIPTEEGITDIEFIVTRKTRGEGIGNFQTGVKIYDKIRKINTHFIDWRYVHIDVPGVKPEYHLDLQTLYRGKPPVAESIKDGRFFLTYSRLGQISDDIADIGIIDEAMIAPTNINMVKNSLSVPNNGVPILEDSITNFKTGWDLGHYYRFAASQASTTKGLFQTIKTGAINYRPKIVETAGKIAIVVTAADIGYSLYNGDYRAATSKSCSAAGGWEGCVLGISIAPKPANPYLIIATSGIFCIAGGLGVGIAASTVCEVGYDLIMGGQEVHIDSDLAEGQIVEAIKQSANWSETIQTETGTAYSDFTHYKVDYNFDNTGPTTVDYYIPNQTTPTSLISLSINPTFDNNIYVKTNSSTSYKVKYKDKVYSANINGPSDAISVTWQPAKENINNFEQYSIEWNSIGSLSFKPSEITTQIGENANVQAQIGLTVNQSGYLQVMLYSSDNAINSTQGTYISSAGSHMKKFDFNIQLPARKGTHILRAYIQFRPRVTQGPLADCYLLDIVEEINSAVIINVDPPPVILTNGGQDFFTNNPNLILSGTAETFFSQVLVNGSANGVNYNQTTGNWTYNTILENGQNQFGVTAKTIGGVESDPSVIKITLDTIKPTITSSTNGGMFNSTQNLTLSSNKSGAKIYYTTDGGEPNITSKIYNKPLQMLKSAKLKIAAIDLAGNVSITKVLDFGIPSYKIQLPNSKWKSFSVNSEIFDIEQAFGQADIRQFNQTTGQYEKVIDKLLPGIGYWIKSTTEQEIEIPVGDYDQSQSVVYNEGFGIVSGYFLKYQDQLKFNDGSTTKTLPEAINAGWIKYMAYYYDNDTYNGLDLRSITSDDVLGRSVWIRFYKPLTMSFDGLWRQSPQRLNPEIPNLPDSKISSGITETITAPKGSTASLYSAANYQENRPIVLAEGFDPLNEYSPESLYQSLNKTVGEGEMLDFLRENKNISVWIINWYNGGETIENLAEDLQYLLQEINRGSNYANSTVLWGHSMGGLVSRYILADAYDQGVNLGVKKLITYDTPHKGAWVNETLKNVLLRWSQGKSRDDLWRFLNAPAAQEMVQFGSQFQQFYSHLEDKGINGYNPNIEKVAFTNGSYGNLGDGSDIIHDFGSGNPMFTIWYAPLCLGNGWPEVIVNGSFEDYYPGDKKMMPNVYESNLLVCGTAEWNFYPTFIPTYSALDFEGTLESIGSNNYKYKNQDQSPFNRVYLTNSGTYDHADFSPHIESLTLEFLSNFESEYNQSQIKTEESIIEEGEPLNFSVTFANPTTSSIDLEFRDGCQVHYYIDGQSDRWLCTSSLSYVTIPPFGKKVWNKSYNPNWGLLTPGQHTIKSAIFRDTNGKEYPVAETTITVTPRRPELSLENLTFNSSYVTKEVTQRIAVDIKNSRAKANNVKVNFYEGDPKNGGQFIDSWQMLSMDPETVQNAAITWTPTNTGIHQIFAVVDPDNSIDELDENNNQTSTSFMVYNQKFYVDAFRGNDSYDGQTSVVISTHGPKKTIHAAVNSASPYDIIQVNPGVYEDNYYQSINLKEGMKLVSNNPRNTIIKTSWAVNLAKNTQISGFTLLNGAGGVYFIGDGTSSNVIENCIIKGGNGSGIRIENVENVLVKNSLIYNLTFSGLDIRNSKALIINNTLDSNGDNGVYLSGSKGGLISNNIFSNNKGGYGIFDQMQKSVVSYNNFYNNNKGAYYNYNLDTTNIFNNPGFVNSNQDLYYLNSSSSAIDKGSTSAASLSLDSFATQQDQTSDSGRVDLGFHYTVDKTAPEVNISPAAGTYSLSQTITLNANEPNSVIYFTTDNSIPTTSSTKYTSAISISETTTLKYFAVDQVGNQGQVQSATYTVYDPTPLLKPVILTNNGKDFIINKPQLTLNGTTDIRTTQILVNGSAIVYTATSASWSYSTTLKEGANTLTVIAKNDYLTSPSASISVTLDTTASTVTATPASGIYSSPQTITFTANEPDSVIYYTTDNSTPTTSSNKYTTPITIAQTTTLKFIAIDLAGNQSEVKSEVYTISYSLPTPLILTNSGQDFTTNNKDLHIYGTIASSTIKDILANGSSQGVVYSPGSFVWNYKGILQEGQNRFEIVAKNNDVQSEPAIITVTLDTQAPILTVTPKGGTYNSSQEVTISANEAANIYYTTDGTTPECNWSGSTRYYTQPITIFQTTTLKFIASDRTAGNKSNVYTEIYTIDTQPPTITASPGNGAYTTAQTITLSANDPDAIIYYTIDGSIPTSFSIKYMAPFSISQTTTLKYFAVDQAGNQSTVKTTVYTIITNQKKFYVDAVKGNDSYDGLSAEVANGHGPQKTLGAAINSATQYDIIQVAPGTYEDNYYQEISLKEGMKLIAENSSNTIIKNTWPLKLAKNSQVKGFTILTDNNGIFYQGDGSGSLTIENCLIKGGNGSGIRIEAVANVLIKNNLIINQDFSGLDIRNSVAIIVNNTLDSNGDNGIYLISPKGGSIINNIISNNQIGFGIYQEGAGTNPEIKNNLFFNNARGTYSLAPLDATNIFADPKFTNANLKSYYLDLSSPAIDQGSDTAVNLGLDSFTTRQDQLLDQGQVDKGFHYSLDHIILQTQVFPKGGFYTQAQIAILTNNELGGAVYYTTDQSTPDTSSAIYRQPISISRTAILKYLAVDAVGNQSEVKTEKYSINTFALTIDNQWRMFSVNKEISDANIFSNADIRRYNNSIGQYEKVTDKLLPSEGYWIKTTGDFELDLPIGDFDQTQSAAFNQGFGLVSGYFLKYYDQLKFSDSNSTKNLQEAISAGWIKYIAYYYDNNTYTGLDLRSITSDNVLGRSFWIRFYKPITMSFDGSWREPSQHLVKEIPSI